MNKLRIADINYRQILIQSFKELGLTEIETMVLLLVDSIYVNNPSLVDGSQLSHKMTLKSAEIDAVLVSLMDKGFLSYEPYEKLIITSVKNTYAKIVAYMERNIFNQVDESTKGKTNDELSQTLQLLQEEMKRSLSSLEIEQVSAWYNEGISHNVITDAINECIMKRGAISIKRIDNLIIKNLAHKDIVKEGFTTVDEKTKMDIKKAMDIASYDWVNNDEN